MQSLESVGMLVGRILIAAIFVMAGVMKLGDPAGTGAYMTSQGIPEGLAVSLLYLAAFVEIIGGLMVGFGYKVRLAGIILFLFLIPTTLIFHLFAHQPTQVLKNLAIMGGLLVLSVHGAGAFSIDSSRGSSA